MSDIAALRAILTELDASDPHVGRFDLKPRPLEVVYAQAKAIGLALRPVDALDVAEGRKPLVGRMKLPDGSLRTYNPRFREASE